MSYQRPRTIRQLIVKASAVPDLDVSITEGLATINGTQRFVVADTTSVVAASANKKKLAIVQVNTSGTISTKYGDEVDEGGADPIYPNPDSNNITLAKLFTEADPILDNTIAVTNTDINNAVEVR